MQHPPVMARPVHRHVGFYPGTGVGPAPVGSGSTAVAAEQFAGNFYAPQLQVGLSSPRSLHWQSLPSLQSPRIVNTHNLHVQQSGETPTRAYKIVQVAAPSREFVQSARQNQQQPLKPLLECDLVCGKSSGQQCEKSPTEYPPAHLPSGPMNTAVAVTDDLDLDDDPNRLPTWVKVRGFPSEFDPRIAKRPQPKKVARSSKLCCDMNCAGSQTSRRISTNIRIEEESTSETDCCDNPKSARASRKSDPRALQAPKPKTRAPLSCICLA